MLELTGFQIFFMILHACLMIFAAAYLFRGRDSNAQSKVVSYREFQKQKAKRNRQTAVVTKVVETHFRDVYEAASGDPLPASRKMALNSSPVRLLNAASPSQIEEDTVTDFGTISLSESKIRRLS